LAVLLPLWQVLLYSSPVAEGLQANPILARQSRRRLPSSPSLVPSPLRPSETKELAEYLASLLKQLALGGAEIASIPAFSSQVFAAELAATAPLAPISLLDAISGAVETMETHLFGRLSDIEVVMPPRDELDLIADTYVRVVEEAGSSD
jgi:hypothetical protein